MARKTIKIIMARADGSTKTETKLTNAVVQSSIKELSNRVTIDNIISMVRNVSYRHLMDLISGKLQLFEKSERKAVAKAIGDLLSSVLELPESLQGERAASLINELSVVQRRLCGYTSDVPMDRKVLLEDVSARYESIAKSGKASDFLLKHWGQHIAAGVVYRPDIKRCDLKLEQALANEFRGRTHELRAILPIKSDEVDARFARAVRNPTRPADRSKDVSALKKRQQSRPH